MRTSVRRRCSTYLERLRLTLENPDETARVKLMVVDEAWRYLRDPAVLAYLAEAAKTWRKKNAALIMATQSAVDVTGTAGAEALLESMPTKLFLANPELPEKAAEIFRLNPSEVATIRGLVSKQELYLRRPNMAATVRLEVDPESYWLCTSSSARDSAPPRRGGSSSTASRGRSLTLPACAREQERGTYDHPPNRGPCLDRCAFVPALAQAQDAAPDLPAGASVLQVQDAPDQIITGHHPHPAHHRDSAPRHARTFSISSSGTSEYWHLTGAANLAFLKPIGEGVNTNVALVCESGRIYSFLVTERDAPAAPDCPHRSRPGHRDAGRRGGPRLRRALARGRVSAHGRAKPRGRADRADRGRGADRRDAPGRRRAGR